MNNDDKYWSDALLSAHFKSLDQAWSDRNSVMLLLAEIRDFLNSEDLRKDPTAEELRSRIEAFASSASRVDRQPMIKAGKKPNAGQNRKTGT